MEVVYLICFFAMGLVFGSFFCCVGERLSNNIKFVTERSVCDNCKRVLKWYDLIPVLSYIMLKGKCRYCKMNISPICIFIELWTGLLFTLSYYSFGFSLDLLLALLVVSMAMIIFSSDLMYMIIPDEALVFFGISIIIVQFFRVGLKGVLFSIFSGCLLFLFMFCLMKFGKSLFKKEALGGGDVKLLFVLGLVLDPFLALISIFLASFIALPISLYLLYKHKEHMIPFGPFLLCGFLIIFFSKITPEEIFYFLS